MHICHCEELLIQFQQNEMHPPLLRAPFFGLWSEWASSHIGFVYPTVIIGRKGHTMSKDAKFQSTYNADMYSVKQISLF